MGSLEERALEEFLKGKKHSTERLVIAVILSLIVGGSVVYVGISVNIGNVQNSFNSQTLIGTQNLPQCSIEELSSLKESLGAIKTERDTCYSDLHYTQTKLELSTIEFSGNVKTVGGFTYPVSITFDDGSGKHTFPINNVDVINRIGSYTAALQNNQAYIVIVNYNTGTCNPLQIPLQLYVNDISQKIQSRNWEC